MSGDGYPCANRIHDCCEHRPHYHSRNILYEWGTSTPLPALDPTPDDTVAPKMHFFGNPQPTTEAERAFRAEGEDVWEIPPDDTAAPYGPYTYGERRRNPYYTVGRDIWRLKDGEEGALMINKNADVTDVIHAFGLGYDLGEVVAKICRLHRKKGTNIRQEFIKMHEHIQAAEDAWVASQVVERLEGE